jgi:hypothetical protein
MSTASILESVASGKLSPVQAAAMLKPVSAGRITFKVSEKGAVSVYGLQRMPVTLYSGQWERLLEQADAIREFIKANEGALSTKAAA